MMYMYQSPMRQQLMPHPGVLCLTFLLYFNFKNFLAGLLIPALLGPRSDQICTTMVKTSKFINETESFDFS